MGLIKALSMFRPIWRLGCTTSHRALQSTTTRFQTASTPLPGNEPSASEASYTAAGSTDDDKKWVMGMPTRMIAHVLLQRERPVMEHSDLFQEANASGMFRSHRHFKHCLKMMKHQKRVHIVCLGPERVGSPNRRFAVSLTKRGVHAYSWYRSVGGYAGGVLYRKAIDEAAVRETGGGGNADGQSKGLAEALP